MDNKAYEIESSRLFSESLIWQLNRNFYLKKGLEAWRDGTVPHHLTSNSMVGKTYAELIFAFLKDIAVKKQTEEKVYILELGAGHGRLAFHILKHLERLIKHCNLSLPPYCYVLSDIVKDNLDFFQGHPQFQDYFEKGLLDVAYFDALESKEILLRQSENRISPGDLPQPLLVIANYFFDSIPSDLFHIENTKISACSVALNSAVNPIGLDEAGLLKHLNFVFQDTAIETPYYEEAILNEILEAYRGLVVDSYLFFPHKGLQCLINLNRLSKNGLLILSMDKGFHEIHDLENVKTPEIITHGSMSIWVNYHAFKVFCEKQGKSALLPSFSTFYSEVACLLFLPDAESYTETKAAYQRFVNDFGPDDFNGLKRFTYRHLARMSFTELISLLRLSAYDSTLFIKVLPRIKQLIHQITFNERKRLVQTMHQTWNMYFSMLEPYDLAYEMGGLFYDLGFYRDALKYFASSISRFGPKADIFYNRALCYYQLREDLLFAETVSEAKAAFPLYERFAHLDKLDLEAE